MFFVPKSLYVPEESYMDNAITRSLPPRRLGLFNESGEVIVDRTVDFLETSKTELASALGISYDNLRQERLTGKARERMEHLASALEYVAEAFEGDMPKTLYWLRTPNLNFGGFSPRSLILKGKYKKVFEFIMSSRS